ncbi:uncharacterized protein LOC142174258 [Nicotiana tabacum]|uniref:Uncharacterized protein LOC142174258 n=1 Tax=Nicotiana tabacum TaxID=4097 RepID=A0AC58TFZ1_TOBAC
MAIESSDGIIDIPAPPPARGNIGTISVVDQHHPGFVNGRYSKDKFDPSLHELWEKWNAILLSWIMNYVSNKLLSGMVYATSAQKEILTPPTHVSEINEGIALFSNNGGYMATNSPSPSNIAMYNNIGGSSSLRSSGPVYRNKKNNLYCNYCHFKGHTKDTCYKLIGYPADFKAKKKIPSINYARDNQSNNDTNSAPISVVFGASVNLARNVEPCQGQNQNIQAGLTGIPQFSQEQYTQILQMLGKGNENDNSYVPAGIANAATATSQGLIKWIADSRASNHMDLFSGKVKEIGREDSGLYVFNHNSKLHVDSAVTTVPQCNASKDFSKSVAMTALLQSFGIIHQSSYVYTPRQNGVAERRHRYILDTARSLRFQASVPLKFWGECTIIVVYVINRVLTPTLQGGCPYEVLHNHLPSFSHLRVFGCLGYVTDLKRGDKVSPRAVPAIFLGYSMTQKGYKMYVIHSRSFQVSREVVFKEDVFPFEHLPTTISSLFSVLDLTTISSTASSISPTSETAESAELASDIVMPEAIVQPLIIRDTPAFVAPTETVDASNSTAHDTPMSLNALEAGRKSTITSRPPMWLKDYVTQKQENANSIAEPKSYYEDVKHKQWIEAMQSEIAALEDNALGVMLTFLLVALVVVLVYVDDLLVTGSCSNLIVKTRNNLKLKFKMKDLDELKFFLRIEFARSRKGIVMSQRKYALKLFSEMGLGGSKPARTPLEFNVKLTS